MKCPKCGHPKSRVFRTERSKDGSKVIRRRLCMAHACGHTWSTVEQRGMKSWATA